MQARFKQVSNKVAFPGMEEKILQYWEKEGVFAKSLEKNKGAGRYTFYDGPPFATGLPHYGHLHEGVGAFGRHFLFLYFEG
ncbi:MAG: class I tRNA ligase family protein [Kiritimatiellae bacterium]|nr:class I tRNA ligase family protein [Kiritimatiellia bacterium]